MAGKTEKENWSAEAERRLAPLSAEEEKALGAAAKLTWGVLQGVFLSMPEYNKALAAVVEKRTAAGLNPLGEPIKFGDDYIDNSVDLSTPGTLVFTSTIKQGETEIVETATVRLGGINNFRLKGTRPFLYFKQDRDGVTEYTREGVKAVDSIYDMVKAVRPHRIK